METKCPEIRAKKETVDIDILITSRNGDWKIIIPLERLDLPQE